MDGSWLNLRVHVIDLPLSDISSSYTTVFVLLYNFCLLAGPLGEWMLGTWRIGTKVFNPWNLHWLAYRVLCAEQNKDEGLSNPRYQRAGYATTGCLLFLPSPFLSLLLRLLRLLWRRWASWRCRVLLTSTWRVFPFHILFVRPVLSLLFGDLALKSEYLVRTALRRIGVKGVEIRKAEQLQAVDALIIPGGESTTMAKLAHYHNLVRPLLSVDYPLCISCLVLSCLELLVRFFWRFSNWPRQTEKKAKEKRKR